MHLFDQIDIFSSAIRASNHFRACATSIDLLQPFLRTRQELTSVWKLLEKTLHAVSRFLLQNVEQNFIFFCKNHSHLMPLSDSLQNRWVQICTSWRRFTVVVNRALTVLSPPLGVVSCYKQSATLGSCCSQSSSVVLTTPKTYRSRVSFFSQRDTC